MLFFITKVKLGLFLSLCVQIVQIQILRNKFDSIFLQ